MKWEYKAFTIETDNDDALSGFLSNFGRERWRIIHCDTINSCFIFERSIESEISEETKRMINYFGGKVG